MASKRSNKTARVLNLIATPSDAAPVEAEQSTVPAASAETQATPAAAPKEKARSGAQKTKNTSKAATSQSTPAVPVPEEPSPASETTASEQPQPQATSAPMPQPVVPIVQTVREKEQQLSDDIKSGLLQALSEAETPAQSTDPSPTSEPQDSAADEDINDPETVELSVPEQETTIEPATESESEQVSLEAPQPEETAPSAKSSEPDRTAIKVPQPQKPAEEIYTPAGEQNVEYTNVLQELVEGTSLYYIENMLQCRCQRCIVDMKALALTNLPSKYVVLEKSKRAAYMSVYAARYEKELSVQMMRACVIINEHPHH